MSWLLPPYDDALLASAFRPAWGRGPIHSLVVQEAIAAAAARRLRALAAPRLTGFSLADRGRYHAVEAPRLRALSGLAEELRAFAAAATGLALAPGAAALLRFRRGDYALRLDDARRRAPGPLLEVTLDLSPAVCPSSDTVYSEGPHTHFQVWQRPAQLALVRRSPQGSRCDRYLSCEAGRRSAWRARAAFPIVGP